MSILNYLCMFSAGGFIGVVVYVDIGVINNRITTCFIQISICRYVVRLFKIRP